ncbi:MAG TPA: hypothetical protein VGM39_01495 [Kofleriaceae bacterium]
MRHHAYLSPGMFGFGRLGSYSYFAHVERELTRRFSDAGHELVVHVIEDLPTASIRRRANRLADIVSRTSGEGHIHLVGHSTGGLDARLVASPATQHSDPDALDWLPRLRSLTTMNTPHFGTPLASFFATAQGQHVLAAISVLTAAGLSVGAQPLAMASVLLGFIRNADRALPMKITLLNRSVENVVSLVDDARSPELRTFLRAIEEDQGSMLQLSPEAMDLVVAGFPDRPGVRYMSTVSMSPPPKPRAWLGQITHPWRAISLSVFFAIHRITSDIDPHYPCAASRDAAPFSDEATEMILSKAFGERPGFDANDGIVPLRSQLWGDVIWAGLGDHLDVLGHYFDEREDVDPSKKHRDWLTSGSAFNDRAFTSLLDALAAGMLGAS